MNSSKPESPPEEKRQKETLSCRGHMRVSIKLILFSKSRTLGEWILLLKDVRWGYAVDSSQDE